MKYAIIIINKRRINKEYSPFHNEYTYRRVLIEYTSYEDNEDDVFAGEYTRFYDGTRIIALDDYFTSSESSHKFTFFDDGYILTKIINKNNYTPKLFKEICERSCVGEKRKYHRHFKFGDPSINEFEAPDDDAAKLIFVLKKDEVKGDDD